jgi:hypothetical protein
MKLILMLVAVMLCCFVSPSYLAADVFEYEVSGVIDSVHNGGTTADGSVTEGERFTMRFTLDTDESLGQTDDFGPFHQTMHYMQSYPTGVDFSGGFSLLATPAGTFWYFAEQARTVMFDAEFPNEQIYGEHYSGQNSDGTLFEFNTSITVQWIDLTYGFWESAAPYLLVDTSLTNLPELAEFDGSWFSLSFVDWNVPPAEPDVTWISGYFDSLSSTPKVICQGFDAPLDRYPVQVRKNRVLPLKMEIYDDGGFAVTGNDLTAPPMLQVSYSPQLSNQSADVTDDALSAGHGTEGNQFVFTDDLKWQFNLKTSNYSGAGTYTLITESGDPSEYVIEPSCITEFVIK